MEEKYCVCCDRAFEGEANVCSDCSSLTKYEKLSLWHQLAMRELLEEVRDELISIGFRIEELPMRFHEWT